MVITSSDNAHLKEIRKLVARRRAREQAGRFVAEGEDLIAAADAAGWTPRHRLCVAGSELGGTEWVEVEPSLLAAVSELGSGTRALAVYDQRLAERAVGPLCLALVGVGDPGNIGTALRGAVAFGAASVALGPHSADPFGPKAVRASMGAVFEVALARISAPGELPGITVALESDAQAPALAAVLDELAGDGDLPPLSLVVGAEREGLDPTVLAACDRVARIPIATHSLNAAMAATVALYEVSRRMARAS